MTAARRVLATLGAIAFALALAWLSRAPTSYAGAGDAQLRLSWRVDGFMVEECRPRTDEELRALAAHMRTPEVCTGGGADFELVVDIDGVTVARDTIVPAGARRDRPVYVFREFDLAPGSYEVRVDFRALAPREPTATDVQLTYAWEGEVRLGATEIALVTLDPEGRGLVARDP